ncbi:unnamed protein product [Phaedon cochleariae]|uniref:Fatty acyl-CoA reductase n=1 Tax=Phaedon cochleariae TaxID=80249 RepID=A0A9P0GS08_PHACE|nr:unnamed protein product [Phaedon cochleariae]
MPFLFDQKKSVMSVTQFFEGKSIFITGSSGFIGKVLIEKLLRTCPGIKNIYILIRPKKNKSIQERVKTMFDVPLFDKLKKGNNDVLNKVLGVPGDITQLNLGLGEKDTKTITDNVSIIYHIAASVRFDDFLKIAITTNTRSTREIITLAKQCKTLDVFVYCSTVYCNFEKDVIEEKVYPAKQDWRMAIELAEKYDEMTLQVLTEKCIHPLPNTYTYTKGLTEQLVIDLCTNQIPAIIVRPSIVLPSFEDPIDGWVDNFNGPMTLNLLAGKGLLKVLKADEEIAHDHVFVDNTVKVLLIATWKKSVQADTTIIEVYNNATDVNFSPLFDREVGNKVVSKNPPESYLWYAYTEFIKNPIIFYIGTLFYHLLPALILDSIMYLTGKKPKIFKLYRKVFIANVSLYPFMSKAFNIRTENYLGLEESLMECDKKELSFINSRMPADSTRTVKAIHIIWKGIKQYLMKEKAYATEEEIKRYARIMTFQKMLYFVVKGFIFYLIISKLLVPVIISELNKISSI